MVELLLPSFEGALLAVALPFLHVLLVHLSIGMDFFFNPTDGGLEMLVVQLTFPNYDHGPAFGLKLSPDLLVPFLIPSDLVQPEIGVGLGNNIQLAFLVTVPETPVDENDGVEFGQDNIGGAWQAVVILPVPISSSP